MRQPFIKQPLPALGAWSLLLSPRPSLVVNMALFSQTKHGPSREVARHTVWCAQTFRLLTGRLNLPVSSPCFTLLMRVYFYQPLWENGPALWQLVPDKEFLIKIEISDHPQSAQPFWVSELSVEQVHPWKELCLFRKQDCSFFRVVMNKSPRGVAKGNYEHLVCTELIAEWILRRVMFYLDLFSNFWILCFPIEFSLSDFLPHTSSRKYWSEMIKYIFYLLTLTLCQVKAIFTTVFSFYQALKPYLLYTKCINIKSHN